MGHPSQHYDGMAPAAFNGGGHAIRMKVEKEDGIGWRGGYAGRIIRRLSEA
jgi:hypothetical protein